MEREAILAAVQAINRHLAAVLIQTIPADDQFIIAHVRAAAGGTEALMAALKATKGIAE